jgi:hypothetical protein
VVLVISDGWDRGDLELLGREVLRLQRATHRLIWLNPLLGSTEYQPIQRGMATVMPCVDDFLPVHNLASLEQLARVLSSVNAIRPVRKQRICRPEDEGDKEDVDGPAPTPARDPKHDAAWAERVAKRIKNGSSPTLRG